MYPFLGLAIVGLVTVKPLTAVTTSPELMVALLIGAALTLAPLVPDRLIPAGRWTGSLPVAVGFVLAAYSLWSGGSLIGIAATAILTLLGCALVVVPWERVPRWLHAASPIGGLLIAMVLEVQFGSSVLKAFPFVLLPLLMLALYFTSLEFAIGAVLAVANIATVAFTNPELPDTGQALLAALTLVALGLLVRRVVGALQSSRATAAAAEEAKTELLANLAQRNEQLQDMTGLLLGTDLTPEQRDYVETIRTSGDTLLEIINDILDFSKIEAGRVRMETIDFSPKHVTEEAVELFAEPAANKGIELILDADPEVPHSVVGDPGRLRQVLINLVGNAIKFTDTGEVVVRLESW